MTKRNSASLPLKWKLLIKKRPSLNQGIPPGKESLTWVANTVTLIYGERDGVLVDTFLTGEHSRELVDWIVASGKKLSTIYITHAHGDHFFGISILQDRFPDVRAVATSYVVKGMHRQIAPEYVASFWRARFPGQIPERLTIAEELENNQIDLERYKLVAVNIGHTDTTNTTCLHVPPLGSL